MGLLKKYRLLLGLLLGVIILTLINNSLGIQAFQLTGRSIWDMLLLLPPVLIFVGLLDSWVEKETMIRYMGEKSGIYGILLALLLGGVAAGPLYVAFPIAILLLKKGASLRYVVFFLGVWTTAKLPVVIYEFSSFGVKFTLIHICFGLLYFYLIGIIFENIFDQRQLLKKSLTENV